MKKIIPMILIGMFSTGVLADRYTNTSFEEVAEHHVTFNYEPRIAAVMNFRTVCDKIYGSDDANCSVRTYNGSKGEYPGKFIDVYELTCNKTNCNTRE